MENYGKSNGESYKFIPTSEFRAHTSILNRIKLLLLQE